ncbi:MAG: type 4a pilus biogenesis protein PilO [Desulfobacterota bacterium]|jgi:type IV pilus assembly protein PilO|nr:type 4a pilus biogenesis protein PilO [Thermodesulfobacteriota bacterium]
MKTGALFEKVEKIKMPIRIAIFAGTIVVLVVAFWYFIYDPYSTEIAQTEEKIAKLQTEINKAKARAANLRRFEAEYAEVDAQFQEALKLLPNTKEIPSLLKSITQLGTDSQLEFLLFSPQRERAQDFFMEIPVSIEVSGTYHNVAIFFDKVGQMERIVNILNVSMAPQKERSTTLTTRFDAVTYRFKGETDATAQPKK